MPRTMTVATTKKVLKTPRKASEKGYLLNLHKRKIT